MKQFCSKIAGKEWLTPSPFRNSLQNYQQKTENKQQLRKTNKLIKQNELDPFILQAILGL